MWESLKYVNNEWALYAVIAISIRLALGSWLSRTERLIERLPENERLSIVKLEFFGNFFFKLLLLSAVVAGFIAFLPVFQKSLNFTSIEVKDDKIYPKEKKDDCPKEYSENLNASVDCLIGKKP